MLPTRRLNRPPPHARQPQRNPQKHPQPPIRRSAGPHFAAAPAHAGLHLCEIRRHRFAIERRGIARQTLLQWALGTDTRGDPPATADAYLLLFSKGQPPASGTRLTPECAKISSILPDPRKDSQMLLVVDGALHILRPSESKPVPVALELPPPVRLGNDPALRLTRLLGVRVQSSSLQILAAVSIKGESDPQVWALTFTDMAVVQAELLPNERVPRTQEEFFATHRSPRCQPGGKDCLILSYDGKQYHLDYEPKRGVKPQALQQLGSTAARDVAWKPGSESMYLVVHCSS
jgi:hypothetical protein